MHPHDVRRKAILTTARDELQRSWDSIANKSQDLMGDIEDSLDATPEEEGLQLAYNLQLSSLNDTIARYTKTLEN